MGKFKEMWKGLWGRKDELPEAAAAPFAPPAPEAAEAPAVEAVDGAGRKSPGRTVIAHISDLHLDERSKLRKGPWAALRQALREQRERVDLLVVTGDLVEVPMRGEEGAYRRARDFLLELAEEVGVDPLDRLLIVPGNHDVRLFQGAGMYRPGARAAFEQTFRREMPACRLFRTLKVVTFLFDSNARDPAALASGYVETEALNRLRDLRQELASRWPSLWGEARRIAVLHHHPMPIGATQMAENQLKGGEPYMLLKNAGVFMSEVLRSELELVLHGHRHYPAVSRASFRAEDGLDRSLLVVAAGSVGKDDDTERSFEILTLEDSGEVRQERHRLKEASYQREFDRELVSYPEARALRVRRRLEERPPQLRVERYACHWSIQAGSGDSELRWNVEGARAYGAQPVAEVLRVFTTRSGYVKEPVYSCPHPGQLVTFVPLDPPTKGRVEFRPPLGASPISYFADLQVINAYHFNRQDRLDATGRQSDRESVSAAATQLHGTLSLSVAFPPGYFPPSLAAEAVEEDAGGNAVAEATETAYLSRYLVIEAKGRTASLVVPDPVPGLRYKISWELPETELAAATFEPSATQEAREIRELLLGGAYRPGVEAVLNGLRERIDGRSRVAESLDSALFVYDAGKLQAVAAAGSSAFREALAEAAVGVGRTHVGQAFRRREAVVGIRTDRTKDADFYYQPERDPAALAAGREACVAIPLVYPTLEDPSAGLRLAVLWLGSSSRLSKLNALADQDDLLLTELESGVRASFGRELLSALSLELDPETGRLVSSGRGALFDDR